jgi:hypothetical protein
VIVVVHAVVQTAAALQQARLPQQNHSYVLPVLQGPAAAAAAQQGFQKLTFWPFWANGIGS